MTLNEKLTELDGLMENAVVTERSEGLYDVVVPGALRQKTTVKAESKSEARKKVRANLATKIEHFANKPVVTGESDGELEVQGMEQPNTSEIKAENNG